MWLVIAVNQKKLTEYFLRSNSIRTSTFSQMIYPFFYLFLILGAATCSCRCFDLSRRRAFANVFEAINDAPFKKGGKAIVMNDKKWKIGEQIRCPRYKDEKLIESKVQYGRSIASNYP